MSHRGTYKEEPGVAGAEVRTYFLRQISLLRSCSPLIWTLFFHLYSVLRCDCYCQPNPLATFSHSVSVSVAGRESRIGCGFGAFQNVTKHAWSFLCHRLEHSVLGGLWRASEIRGVFHSWWVHAVGQGPLNAAQSHEASPAGLAQTPTYFLFTPSASHLVAAVDDSLLRLSCTMMGSR